MTDIKESEEYKEQGLIPPQTTPNVEIFPLRKSRISLGNSSRDLFIKDVLERLKEQKIRETKECFF